MLLLQAIILLLVAPLFARVDRPVLREIPGAPPNAIIVEKLPKRYRIVPIPENFDWREVDGHNWITPIRTQGTCGSCWAFAAVAQFEAAVKIFSQKYSLQIDIAEQELVSCDTTSSACFGGYFPIEYFQNIGIVDEYCFPYSPVQDTLFWYPCDDICIDASTRRNYRLTAQVVSAGYSIDKLKSAVYNAPVYIVITVYRSFHELGTVSENYVWLPSIDDGFMGYHAMLCVGWDDNNQCLIFKNSWDEDFGYDGFVKIGYACMSSGAEKPVWADGLLYPTQMVSAKIVQNWIFSSTLIKTDTSYIEIDTVTIDMETDEFLAAGDKWYKVESWRLTKDFIFDTDSQSGDGYGMDIAFDSPMVIEWSCVETTVIEGCLSENNLIICPNPFIPGGGYDELVISFRICKDGYVDTRIYDTGYNLVRVFDSGHRTAGEDIIFGWDGTDAQGVPVSPGVYFVVAKNKSGEFAVGKAVIRAWRNE